MISNCQTSMEISDKKLFEYLTMKASKLRDDDLRSFLDDFIKRLPNDQIKNLIDYSIEAIEARYEKSK